MDDEVPDFRQYCVPDEGGGERLDVWLCTQMPELSRARIQALLKDEAITLAGTSVKANRKTRPGEIYLVEIPPPEPADPQAEDIPLCIVYEDSDLIVIDKQAGLVVHPAVGHASGTLVNALLFHCGDLSGVGGIARPGIVHRLDKDTTGLMVAAKNDIAMNGLVEQFKTGGVHKIYLAVVHGVPVPGKGTIRTLIGRHPIHRQRMAVVARNGKDAITHWELEKAGSNGTALVRCRIETGRTHQIRVHMSHLGFPIVGDSVYGNASKDKRLGVPDGQLLHSTQLSFIHPRTGLPLTFKAPPPPGFERFFS